MSFLESMAASFRMGQIFHPWLGFQVERDPDHKKQLLVRDVAELGPAYMAGILEGNTLLSMDRDLVKTTLAAELIRLATLDVDLAESDIDARNLSTLWRMFPLCIHIDLHFFAFAIDTQMHLFGGGN